MIDGLQENLMVGYYDTLDKWYQKERLFLRSQGTEYVGKIQRLDNRLEHKKDSIFERWRTGKNLLQYNLVNDSKQIHSETTGQKKDGTRYAKTKLVELDETLANDGGIGETIANISIELIQNNEKLQGLLAEFEKLKSQKTNKNKRQLDKYKLLKNKIHACIS